MVTDTKIFESLDVLVSVTPNKESSLPNKGKVSSTSKSDALITANGKNWGTWSLKKVVCRRGVEKLSSEREPQ